MEKRLLPLVEQIDTLDTYPSPVAVDYDPMDFALSDARMTSKRFCEYVAKQEVAGLDFARLFGQIRFDGSFMADIFTRTGHKNFHIAGSSFYNKPQDNLVVFEWQHSTPNYQRVMESGISGMLSEIQSSKACHRNEPEKVDYLEAMEECCHGIISWAHRCAAACRERAEKETGLRQAELLESARVLEKVPEFPAETFPEALQSLYLCFDMLPDSIGTIDRFLYPYYRHDLEAGTLTEETAKGYLQELFLRIQCRTPLTSSNRKKGGECHFAIGGYTANHEDGFNDLSRLIVEALMEMPMHIPQISLRWTKKTPRSVLRYLMDCERNDPYKRIAFINDEPRLEGFMKRLGLSFADAVNYTMVGCNEPAFQGTMWFGGETVNLARCLVRVLYEQTEQTVACRSFEEFFALFEKSLAADLDEILNFADRFNAMRAKDNSVLSALFLDGCIQSGVSPTRGGCRLKIGGADLMGITCVIDSLTVIRQFVFEEKRFTLAELIDNLRSDWKKNPAMRTLICKKARFFGNDEPISNRMAVAVTDLLAKYTENRRMMNGEHILFGSLAGYNAHYATFGKLTPATPDGRYDGEAFMVGVGQTGGRDREGLTALLSSIAGMQPSGILCGPYVVNITLDEKLIREDACFEKTVDEFEAYFKMGGMHFQLNYVSRELLEQALAKPQDYGNLKVRVSGFSGIFVELAPSIQTNVMERTKQS